MTDESRSGTDPKPNIHRGVFWCMFILFLLQLVLSVGLAISALAFSSAFETIFEAIKLREAAETIWLKAFLALSTIILVVELILRSWLVKLAWRCDRKVPMVYLALISVLVIGGLVEASLLSQFSSSLAKDFAVGYAGIIFSIAILQFLMADPRAKRTYVN